MTKWNNINKNLRYNILKLIMMNLLNLDIDIDLILKYEYLILSSSNNKFILNKIIPIENELDFLISSSFNYIKFFNFNNSEDI